MTGVPTLDHAVYHVKTGTGTFLTFLLSSAADFSWRSVVVLVLIVALLCIRDIIVARGYPWRPPHREGGG